MSHSLWPRELQHGRLLCPSLSPWVCSNSCPLSRWCHPTISVALFSCCLQSFPASGSFPVSQLFTSGGQSTGDSASASVFPMNIQTWYPLGWTGLISLQSRGLSRVFFQHHSFKASVFQHSAFFMVPLSHPYMITGKTIALNIWTFVSKVMLIKTQSRFDIALLPRSKHLFILWLWLLSTLFGDQENEIWHCFLIFPSYLPWSDRTGCHNLSFLDVEF